MSLDDLRQQIDTLDRQLVELLVARSRVTAEIGAVKRERGLALYAFAGSGDEPAADLGVEISCASGQTQEGLVDSLPDSIVRGVHEIS